ncbi:hypothetical protein VTL71DRAFT_15276 [Oculimacula yallundae]|uniref:Uncharacterized protein n=1 Tax=Oculimacula yallundae TaxID=86028 RepID=A0ABR4CG82_9HELO
MVSSTTISSLLAVTAIPTPTPQVSVLNIINPIFALPRGKNATGPLGASIVGVENSTTTYQIGCNSLVNHTRFCGWSTAPPFLVTQDSTSQHFTWANTGDSGESVTIQADYTFSSTLAPTITGTFSLVNVEISNLDIETMTDYVTSTFSDTTLDPEATWYAVPVTGGLEKLSSGATITSGSSKATASIGGTGAPPVSTTSTTAAGERVGGKGALLAGLLGVVGMFSVFVL